MRGLIRMALARDPEIEVVGEAADPLEAREQMKALDPDVVTLDVEMPNMNGIEFLEKIMRLRPTPVIMVSNLTSEGTEATIKALEIGAFDCVCKPVPGEEIFADLPQKVKTAARARLRLVVGKMREPIRRRHPELRAERQDRRHRRLDRRRRGSSLGALALSGKLSADRHHAAYALDIHKNFCGTAEPCL